MSIEIVHLPGRYGNNLFPYLMARILSEKLNLKLNRTNLYDFDFSFEQTNRLCLENPIQIINEEDIWSVEDFEKVLLNTEPRKIIINAGFQNVKQVYLKYKKDFLNYSFFKKINVPNNEVGLHIRLGDLLHNGQDNILPLKFYEKALTLLNFSKINICTDSPEHEMVKYLCQKYNGNVYSGAESETISFLSSHKKLILSQGTFSFWCGYFCEGDTIINAIPHTGWNTNGLLLIYDDPKYINISLDTLN